MIFHIGYVIPTTNSKFDPNKLYPWQTWERYAKGKTLVGVDEGDTTFASVGLAGGEKTHKLTVSEMPAHQHKIAYYLSTWSDTLSAAVNAVPYGGTVSKGVRIAGNGNSMCNAGDSGAHNNLQPYVTVYYWRRTA